MYAYKIFESRNGLPCTLFHGLEGSRQLSVDAWLAAENKMVNNDSRANPYLSGFHSYPDLPDVYAWFSNATILDRRFVTRVEISDCWKKPNAVRLTYLSNLIRIAKKDWVMRVPAETFMENYECMLSQ